MEYRIEKLYFNAATGKMKAIGGVLKTDLPKSAVQTQLSLHGMISLESVITWDSNEVLGDNWSFDECRFEPSRKGKFAPYHADMAIPGSGRLVFLLESTDKTGENPVEPILAYRTEDVPQVGDFLIVGDSHTFEVQDVFHQLESRSSGVAAPAAVQLHVTEVSNLDMSKTA